jgi:hypothetical protein
MGREKRIAESRTKEMMEGTKHGDALRPNAPTPSAVPNVAVAQAPVAHTGTARALLQILMLYLLPTLFLLVIGKFIFRL